LNKSIDGLTEFIAAGRDALIRAIMKITGNDDLFLVFLPYRKNSTRKTWQAF
jgi:hypothetical protein